jgi:hypothetical protein
MFTQGRDSRLVLSSGFGLGSTTVFTSGSKPNIRSGKVLGLGYGLDFEQGFYFGFMTRNTSGISLLFNLGFCLGLNLSFILGLGLRNSM